MKMKDVLFLPGLKKNLLSIFALDEKGMRVAFVDAQVLMWPKGKTIDDAVVIKEQKGGLYKLKAQPEQDLVHELVEPNELWHRRLSHVHYRELLPLASKAVEGLLEIESNKKVMILQVMKNMFVFLPSREVSHMEAMIGL